MSPKHQRIEVEPITGQIKVGDYYLGAGVLGAILDADARVLWQFIKKDGEIQAIPYFETEVVWIDKEG